MMHRTGAPAASMHPEVADGRLKLVNDDVFPLK